MRKLLLHLLCTAGAVARTLAHPVPVPQLAPVTPLLNLRGGAYPRASYYAFQRHRQGSDVGSLPNLLSGSVVGRYVLCACVLSLTVAGLTPGNAGLQKLIFGALFPIALLNILPTSSQLHAGNTAGAAAAAYEGLVTRGTLVRNWIVTRVGDWVGALVFAYSFKYAGLLTGTMAKMAAVIKVGKCKSEDMHPFV